MGEAMIKSDRKPISEESPSSLEQNQDPRDGSALCRGGARLSVFSGVEDCTDESMGRLWKCGCFRPAWIGLVARAEDGIPALGQRPM